MNASISTNNDSQKSLENFAPYLVCISKNKNVKTVLRYLKEKNESNFAFNYYKILEIIGEDLGSKKDIPKKFNCISNNKFSNLTYSLNNGMEEKSRHYAKSTIETKVLNKEEIEELLKAIINEWISIKCK